MTRRRVRDVSWSIAGLARISGVSPRTLRHYDAIGLLAPAWVAGNGWRHYEQEQLLRLQQILLMQNLDWACGRSQRSPKRDSRGRRGRGLATLPSLARREQERLRRLVHTIDRTIDDVQEGGKMPGAVVFEGFEHNPYEARHASGGATTQSTRRTSG
jgi:DNA-binding transcriptional MerR regulator